MHIFVSKRFPTVGASATLFFVSGALLRIGELAEGKASFVMGEDIFVHTGLLGDFIVSHQFADFGVEFRGKTGVSFVAVVEQSPLHRSHFLAVLGELRLDPFDDLFKIIPKVVCVFIVLMLGDKFLDRKFVSVGKPSKNGG